MGTFDHAAARTPEAFLNTIWQIILIFRDVKRAAVRRGSSDLYFLYMAGTGVGRLLSQA